MYINQKVKSSVISLWNNPEGTVGGGLVLIADFTIFSLANKVSTDATRHELDYVDKRTINYRFDCVHYRIYLDTMVTNNSELYCIGSVRLQLLTYLYILYAEAMYTYSQTAAFQLRQ